MTFKVDISAEDFAVSSAIPHMQQVDAYRVLLNRLIDGEKSAKEKKQTAKKNVDTVTYFEADVELDRITSFWMPFLAAGSKAEKLKNEGYVLAAPDGEVSPPMDGYVPDAIVTLFLIIVKAVIADFAEKFGNLIEEQLEGKITFEQMIEGFAQLTPGLRILQDFRDQIIPRDDTGEIAELIRDPIKRPIEIIQNLRDGLIDPSDSGEIAQIARDPVKRPVEIITGAVKKFFGL